MGHILGFPGHITDMLEAQGWNISVWDIALNLKQHKCIESFEQYIADARIPPARRPAWWHVAPNLKPALKVARSELRVAVIGEHAATNIDSAASACAAHAAYGDAELPPMQCTTRHYFTYLWHLNNTRDAHSIDIAFRWEDFFMHPLTGTPGRESAALLDVEETVVRLRAFLEEDAFFMAADVWTGCEPFWVCILVQAAFPEHSKRLIARVNMCPFYLYHKFFGSVDSVWPLLRAFLDSEVPISASSRYSAEAFEHISGKRIPYIPCLGLHTKATYLPRSEEVMVFRSALPFIDPFKRIVNMLYSERHGAREISFMSKGMAFQDMGHYLAVVLLPHVVNALRLSDLLALNSPNAILWARSTRRYAAACPLDPGIIGSPLRYFHFPRIQRLSNRSLLPRSRVLAAVFRMG
eukprot:GEMP01034755.1.p1 GENE.GEMP01034755.1~~GEMP01034755.1.p1  ORF type:complete len:409 (+),score=73.87 GEMP01034755.1:636-1862(+)